MGMIVQRAARARELLLPWSGLIGAGAGWMLSQQIGSMQAFDNCRGTNPLVVVLIGLAGLALAGVGGWIALMIWREQGSSSGARRLIAGVGAGMAALAIVAIILQTAASLVIPQCFG